MRIGLVRRRYVPDGGAEQTAAQLAAGLAARGHAVALVAERWEACLPTGVAGHAVRVPPGPAALRLILFSLRAVRAARALPVEVVLSLERTPGADVFRAGDGCHRAWLAARARAVGRPVRVRDLVNPLHRAIVWLERRLLEAADPPWVVANSRMVRADLLRYYRIPAERIAVIYNGVDAERFRPPTPAERAAARSDLGLGAEELVLLLVGSGFARKGVASLVRAAGILHTRARQAGVHVLVAGRGAPEPYLRLAREAGLPRGTLRFLGPVSDVVPLYHAADLFVLPSLYDPCANACLEAMAAGLPVVTSAANGAAELVEGIGGDTVLPDPMDAVGLADRIAPLLDAGARRARAATARALVRDLSPARMVEETARVCQRARDERKSRGRE